MSLVLDPPAAASPPARHAPPAGARLRIALFADGVQQPRWLVEAFSRIAASGFAEIVLIGVRLGDRALLPWWWRACQRADRWLFGIGADLSEPADLSIALSGCCCLPLPNSRRLPAPWRKQITESKTDVIFVLGDLDPAEFDHLAPYGVWRYCFGNEYGVSEDLAGFREVFSHLPITASGLRVRLGPGADYLLCQSSSRTFPYSVARNRANLLRKTALFAERELCRLHRQGTLRLSDGVSPLNGSAPWGKAALSGGELLRGLSRVGSRAVGRALQKLATVEQWFIAFQFGLPMHGGDLNAFFRLMPGKDRIWADPFPIRRDGRYFIFFEELLFSEDKGRIVVTEVRPDGSHTPPHLALERDYHLSYPFLVEWEGELYMVPESGQNRTVELYRCVRFPDRWCLEKVLLNDVAAADATLYHDGERWWMFLTIGVEGAELYDELHIYHADDLLGEWHPHGANPVKSDVRGARPAGGVFRHDGALLRPAQICAPLYGSGIAINRIRQLTPSRYEEEEIERILPNRSSGVLGVHTLNHYAELNVMDGFFRRSRV